MAVCGETLPLGCEQALSNSNTSAELAGPRCGIFQRLQGRGQTNNQKKRKKTAPQRVFWGERAENQKQLPEMHPLVSPKNRFDLIINSSAWERTKAPLKTNGNNWFITSWPRGPSPHLHTMIDLYYRLFSLSLPGPTRPSFSDGSWGRLSESLLLF